MKWLVIITSTFVLILAALYALLFTGPGNGIIAPLLEKKINSVLALETTLQDFTLRPGSFSVNLLLSPGNNFAAKGDFALFSQTLAATYQLVCDDLNGLAPLTKTPLFGKFHTEGAVSGKLTHLLINGTSDLAEGQTTYSVTLVDYNPAAIVAKISDTKAAKILLIIGKKPFSDGNISLDMNLANIDPQALAGEVVLTIDKGVVDTTLMQDEFGLTLPETSYSLKATAHLAGKVIRYTTTLESNLAYLTSAGTMTPASLQTDLKYQLDAKELGLFKPLTNAPLRGPLKTSGTVKGDRRQMVITGSSNLAESRTTYDLTLEDLKPSRVSAKVQGARLDKLLYLLGQPAYANGRLGVDLALNDLNPENLQGTVTTEISQGLLDGKVFAREFETGRMPETTFQAATRSELAGNFIDTTINISSSLATLKTNRSRFDLKTASLTSDYQVEIPDLDRLFFITERHLKGAIVVTGELKKGEQLELSAHSDILGGTLDTTIHDDEIHSEIKNLQTMAALEMLLYPEIFASSLNGTLDYNSKGKEGTFAATITEGKFADNIMFDLLRDLAKTDLYKELFTGSLQSKISGDLISSDFELRSRNSAISSKGAILDSKKRQVDAKIDVLANNNPLTVTLTGNVDRPQVKLNAEALLKKEATKALQKEVNKLLQKLF